MRKLIRKIKNLLILKKKDNIYDWYIDNFKQGCILEFNIIEDYISKIFYEIYKSGDYEIKDNYLILNKDEYKLKISSGINGDINIQCYVPTIKGYAIISIKYIYT